LRIEIKTSPEADRQPKSRVYSFSNSPLRGDEKNFPRTAEPKSGVERGGLVAAWQLG
jgi:hypothetical protein